MTLEQLRIFVAVAEREHVTRAAAFLNLTQSAVSHAVTQLEHDFQLSFFNRIGRGIKLTEAGSLFLEEARVILNRTKILRDRITGLNTLNEGTLHLHASHTIANYWLPARLNRFLEKYPKINLTVTIANTYEIEQLIQSGEASIGFVEGDITRPELASHVVAYDQLLLVVSPEHPWASHTPKINDITKSSWILREKGSGTRAALEKTIDDSGINPSTLKIIIELASNEAVASAVETSFAATVLSASVVAGRIESGLLCSVPLPFPEREFRTVQRTDYTLTPAEKSFLASLTPTVTKE